jgi:hypothetical protein
MRKNYYKIIKVIIFMTIKVLIGRHILYMEIFGIKIGGFSNEFDPGIGSDSDLNMKL